MTPIRSAKTRVFPSPFGEGLSIAAPARIAWSGCITAMAVFDKRCEQAWRDTDLPFLVVGKISVDQAADIVGIFLFLLKESVVLVARIVFDFDFLVRTDIDRGFGCLSLIERNHFRPRLSVGFVVVFGSGAHHPCKRSLLNGAALGTDDRRFAEIEEFRAAMLALVLVAELGFRHG